MPGPCRPRRPGTRTRRASDSAREPEPASEVCPAAGPAGDGSIDVATVTVTTGAVALTPALSGQCTVTPADSRAAL